MGKPQDEFCHAFEDAFTARFGDALWIRGQFGGNMIALPGAPHLRRGGLIKQSEKIELGDRRLTFRSVDIMVEYESGAASPYNIMKHWPYLRGDLNVRPARPTLLCCFCDWWSYGAIRDVSQWVMTMMENDITCRVKVRMFDHARRSGIAGATEKAIGAALDWIDEETKLNKYD
jgi:hypothetical protein